MTNDSTNVDTDELGDFARALRDRSADLTAVADGTGGIDLGFAPFGVINQWFGHLVREGAHESTAQLRTLAGNLLADADTLDASAADFDNRDQNRAATFRGMTSNG